MLRSLVGSEMCIRDSLLPVANPKQLSPYDATLHMQYALAYRDDPLITNVYLPLFLARYSFVSKSFGDDIPVLTDAPYPITCLLYTSDAADEEDSVDLGGRRIIKKKKKKETKSRTIKDKTSEKINTHEIE
eukprot:TRINITY_DN18794_c0_g1_i2.p1 TRINITY_DN18794_c0_g1~~TRINITY_DN18794_c0_g1_i2.p1  ORF type:complete len:131 (-),score=25.90 TRINITY_DN18794_c0_g1_i2:46-438(-)